MKKKRPQKTNKKTATAHKLPLTSHKETSTAQVKLPTRSRYETPCSVRELSDFSAVQFVRIDANYHDQRIDNFLLAKLKNVPKSLVYRIIRKGEVRANKKRVDNKYRLQENDIIRIPPVKVAEKSHSEAPSHWQNALLNAVIYEDGDLLVLNKPSGLAVHGGSSIDWGVIEIVRQTQSAWQDAELIHRIDKDTSGILLLAKKRAALRYYHELLRDQHDQLIKTYRLLVHGKWHGSEHTITAPLQRTTMGNERIVRVDAEGKHAETTFTVEQHLANTTLLTATIKTGRTHQIRVHAKHAGHVIVGDSKYGDKEADKVLKPARMMLHAHSYELPLRAGGQKIFTAPLDNQWNATLSKADH